MPINQEYLASPKTGLNRQDFLNRLNRWVQPRYGVTVKHRMLSSWCDEKLMPGPVTEGLGHGLGTRAYWDAMSYRSACKICRHKSQGVKSTDVLRILLWLAGQRVPIKDLRNSCVRELKKLRSSPVMSPRSLADPSHDELSKTTLKSIAKGMGPLDPSLAPMVGFDYTDREKTDMLALAQGDKLTRI